MVDITVILTVKSSDDVEKVRQLLVQQAILSRQEPGCERFEVYESSSTERTFILIERWVNQDALDVHRTAHAFTTVYAPQVLPLVDRVPYVCSRVE
ncbi:MAG: antibiotic biosynthesis monooxygenase [Planctomycetaceae bacterium]|nr:antibiotic biosynthesis monooxygenase [Planctomycetaceae bacterium]